jgi:hypothetical protein
MPWRMLPKELGYGWHDLLAAFTRLAVRGNLGLDSLRLAELAFA